MRSLLRAKLWKFLQIIFKKYILENFANAIFLKKKNSILFLDFVSV